jgi:hypothetical protein
MPFYTDVQFSTTRKVRQTSKTKATIPKPIRFYYAMGAGLPAPTVPSNQVFYQALWDDLDRSNRSLKQIARHKPIKPHQEELNH